MPINFEGLPPMEVFFKESNIKRMTPRENGDILVECLQCGKEFVVNYLQKLQIGCPDCFFEPIELHKKRKKK